MAKRKSDRDLTKVTIRLFTDQLQTISDIYPEQETNIVIRKLLDAALNPIKQIFSEARKQGD